MRERIEELLKNILLVLLAISAAVLAFMAYSGNYAEAQSLESLRSRTNELLQQDRYRIVYAGESAAASVAARPVRISVRTGFGRMSVQRDFTALDEVYERLGGLLGEGLERADGRVEPCEIAELCRLLEQPSLYFGYDGALPVDLLARWLGVETALDETVSALVLAQDGEEHYCLALVTADGPLRCGTVMDQTLFRDALAQCRPDGSSFAFERTEAAFRRLDPISLLCLDMVRLPAAAADSPAERREFAADLVEQLGFNPYVGGYTTADGMTAYEESTGTLFLNSSGALLIQNSASGQLQADSAELWNLTDYARSLLERVTAPGDARLYLTGAVVDGDETTLTFDYFLSGIRIRQTAGSAATVQFSGAALQRLELNLRTYSLSGEQTALLPELQAAAIEPEGAWLSACYLDRGGEILTLGWDMGE